MHTIITFLVLILAVGTSAQTECPAGTGVCNGTTYEKALFHCAYDQTRGHYMICPSDFQACNGACFNSTSYNCVQGTLAAISPPPATSASTTSAAPQPTAAATCPTWLKACGQACYADGDYCCTNDLLQPGPCDDDSDFCPSWLQRCGDACYLATEYCCQNDLLSSGACGGATQQPKPSTTSKSTSSTTKATTSTTKQATPTTSAPVVVNPTPSPNNFPTQTADLRIINNCKDTLWFEGRYGGSGGPIPGQSSTVTRALPGSYVDYTVPSTGLPGTRFWAKYGCDSNGRNCLIGDQMQYWPNPPGGCPAAGCSPPVDSLFEATWGCKPGSNCANTNPTTWFDTSQVDGWTIPYKLTPVGDTSKCDCSGSNCGFKGVDASTLDLAKCPTGDDLSNNGQFPSVTSNGKTTNLRSVDLRIIDSQKRVIGCMSPCKKLNWSAPYGLGQSESSGSALWMCCPTPNPANCNPANGCVLPDACRAGPIEKTQYVSAVHTMAPGVYSFSYDDGVGLHACPAGIVKYTMEFCPKGASSYPLQL